jgi:AcrR family transcriptional regulator
MVKDKAPARDLREACINEAARIIDEKGLEALSMREVARRLGVSHQAPYKHFESRDHILAELVVRALASFAAALEARPAEADPYQDVQGIGRAYIDYAAAHPLNYRLMFGSAVIDPRAHPALVQAGRRAFGILLTAIQALPSSRGRADRSEVDALFAWSAVHGVASLRQSHAVTVLDLNTDTHGRLTQRTLERVAVALGWHGPRRD